MLASRKTKRERGQKGTFRKSKAFFKGEIASNEIEIKKRKMKHLICKWVCEEEVGYWI